MVDRVPELAVTPFPKDIWGILAAPFGGVFSRRGGTPVNQAGIIVKYQLVIFDSDGTLADTLPWMRSVLNELADEYGFRRVQPHEYERFRQLHGGALLRELGLPLWKLPRVVSAVRRMAAHTGKFSKFPGISEMLTRLADGGAQLGVVSSNSRENVERVLGPEDSPRIQHWACGVSLLGKATKLHQVVRQSGVPRAGAIYIGDEIRDAEAATNAGLAFGAVTWGHHPAEAFHSQHPAEIFATVREIADRLCQASP